MFYLLHVDKPWQAADRPQHSRPDSNGQEEEECLHHASALMPISCEIGRSGKF